jgi:hypothetical protein
VEFVRYDEIKHLCSGHSITEVPVGEHSARLEMADSDDAVHLHVSTEDSHAEVRDAARVIHVGSDRLASIVGEVLHTLHVTEVILLPVGRWRRVFDAVAFSLAEDEDWQTFETAATVELNTRDPLLVEPSDYQMLSSLVKALISDAEEPDQGFAIITPAAPLLIDIVPDGAIRISFGNGVLADEISDVVHA